jgi:hypothetical protein
MFLDLFANQFCVDNASDIWLWKYDVLQEVGVSFRLSQLLSVLSTNTFQVIQVMFVAKELGFVI